MTDAPWNMSPVTEYQTDYFNNLIESLQEKWPKLDTTIARSVLTSLNEVRRKAGIPFTPYE